MRRQWAKDASNFFSLVALLVCACVALAQSGRTGAAPKPPPMPVASPDPDKLQTGKSSKPSLPEIVDGERVYKSREADERAQILSKPTPGYNREARRHQIHGIVILRAILSADETVKHIAIETRLPFGLSEEAIKAAQRIRFKPAKKDGKPVSVWVEVEYHFDLLTSFPFRSAIPQVVSC